MGQIKLAFQVLLTSIIGLLIFLVLLAIVNLLSPYISNIYYNQATLFLNNNVWLILSLTVIILIGNIFQVLDFPLNLPYPLFKGVSGFLIVLFIFQVFLFIEKLTNINFPLPLDLIAYLIAFLVLIIVIIMEYIYLFSDISRGRHKRNKTNNQ